MEKLVTVKHLSRYHKNAVSPMIERLISLEKLNSDLGIASKQDLDDVMNFINEEEDSGGGLNSLITFLNGVVDSKAPIDSPVFVGTPTAPTPNISDNSTKLATTEFVKNHCSFTYLYNQGLLNNVNKGSLNCNFLLINLTDRFSNTNEFAYFLLTNDTRANWSNVPTDMIAGVDYFGMREVFWIEKGSVLVKVTEFSPSLNRIHMNLYKSSKWSGWFSTGGKFDLVDVTVLGKKHTYGRDGSNLFIHAPADNNYYSPVLTGSGYTALFTLNVGYRPARNIHQRIIINNKGQTGIISIFTTGVVSIGYVRSASGVSENQLAEESFWYFTCSLI